MIIIVSLNPPFSSPHVSYGPNGEKLLKYQLREFILGDHVFYSHDQLSIFQNLDLDW